MTQSLITYSPEVHKARQEGQPLVALESTIIAHGMPYPQNLETAHLLEDTVRKRGAVPATIAVLDGRIRVGLDQADLEKLANGDHIAKLSRRDLPVVMAQGGNGATTVAATMICAAQAGIRVFATGGIGGVHRGGQTSMDVSADLTELSRTSVAVVCAGAKSILDLGRTLEYLETQGVPVLGYRSDDFPAFYTRTSGFPVPARADDAATVARILETKWALGLDGGVVIANPVPEHAAMDLDVIEAATARALEEADQRNITGKAITPFLLDRLAKITEGASLKTNIALARNNADLAAEIACCLGS